MVERRKRDYSLAKRKWLTFELKSWLPFGLTLTAKKENAKAVKCRKRLYKRKKTLEERGFEKNKVYAALARELCEWIYWIATENAA